MKYFTKSARVTGALIAFQILVFSGSLFAQNKTLGVGTTTLNPNAALHVESPTNNQGFIMPRLTTAQRTAMSSVLTAADNGLMLFDTDAKTIYVWDGAVWKSNANTKLEFPYKDSVVTATGTPDLMALKYNNAENKRILRIENLNATNGSSALSVRNEGTGFAGYFQVANATAGGSALTGTTNSNLGGVLSPVGVYGESTGTGSSGGAFRINNPANNLSALYAETNGTGAAGSFKVINGSNAFTALYANTDGSGPNSSAMMAETSTAFSAIIGRATAGTSNGVTGISASTDPGSYAVLGFNQGPGPGGAFSSSTGLAIDMSTGTLKYSTAYPNFTADGAIPARAGVISITGTAGTSITFGWTAVEGETVYVRNNTGIGSISVEGALLSDQQFVQFIYIDGAWRSVY